MIETPKRIKQTIIEKIILKILLFLLAIAIGFLFMTSSPLKANNTITIQKTTIEQVENKYDQIKKHKSKIRVLEKEIQEERINKYSIKNSAITNEMYKQKQGSGIVIELYDAPEPKDYSQVTNLDEYVVHQQDIDAVLNALRKGGAKNISVQDKQVTPTTNIRCVGNVIIIDGELSSPPYIIKAIGSADKMQKSINSDDEIKTYKNYVKKIGLGWKMYYQMVTIPPISNKIRLDNIKVI